LVLEKLTSNLSQFYRKLTNFLDTFGIIDLRYLNYTIITLAYFFSYASICFDFSSLKD